VNYQNLPEKFKDYFNQCANSKENLPYIIEPFISNFEKIPKSIREDLIIKLSKEEKYTRNLIEIIALNYSELPNEIREILLNLATKESNDDVILELITSYFYEIPDEIRNLLFVLMEKDNIIPSLAAFINGAEMQMDLRDKLVEKLVEKKHLINNKETLNKIAEITEASRYSFLSGIPENLRKNLESFYQTPLEMQYTKEYLKRKYYIIGKDFKY
jgi:hypothetical protein